MGAAVRSDVRAGPRIVGNAAGLHPVWIMLALALGGAMLGFAGLLLAVPLAILIRMAGTRVVAMWKESASYRNGALATDRPDGE